MYTKLTFIALFFISYCHTTWATQQLSDIVFYKGTRFYYAAGDEAKDYPLHQLVQYKKYSQLLNLNEDGSMNLSSSSGLYRGYKATWIVHNDIIHLKALEGRDSTVDLKRIFGARCGVHGVKAFWLTDTINIGSSPFSIFSLTERRKEVRLFIKKGRIFKATSSKYSPPQVADKITYQEKEYRIKSDFYNSSFPLFPLLEHKKYRDKFPRDKYGQIRWRKLLYHHRFVHIKQCLRDYKAIWFIKDGYIYLKAIKECLGKTLISPKHLKAIFGAAYNEEEGVKAFWLTDTLKLSTQSSFSKETGNQIIIELKVRKGRIVE